MVELFFKDFFSAKIWDFIAEKKISKNIFGGYNCGTFIVLQYIYIVLYRITFTLYCTALHLYYNVYTTFTLYCCTLPVIQGRQTVLAIKQKSIYTIFQISLFNWINLKFFCNIILANWISVKFTVLQPVLYQCTKIKTQKCHMICSLFLQLFGANEE